MEEKFEMVAKTLKGLEAVLADELRGIGAEEVKPGRRMVSFVGDLEMLYKANLCCRTALRILKPFYKFEAKDADVLYEKVKEYDWSTLLSVDKTFCIDAVVNSEEFSHSRFVTYKVKDAIVDWFRDKYGSDKRPGVRLKDADIMINVHITDEIVTLSLDSSGESLHKRGYRVAQNEAPISEVLAAGIILMTGWKGETPFIDPMCGSGTFLIEAAMIAANINPGIYRKSFAFETWPDFDRELFENLYNDDSNEREVTCKIIGADISPKAIEITRENLKSAGLAQYVSLEVKPISQWESAPEPAGVVVTNPPYGERISAPDMEGLYSTIGSTMKNAFVDYHVWIIGYREEYFQCIGLAPSQKVALMNGALDCELREYVIFSGNKKAFLASGGKLKEDRPKADRPARRFDDDARPHKFRDRDDEEDGGFRKKRRFDDEDKRPRKFRDRDAEEDGDFRKKRRFDDDARPRKFRDRDGEDGDFRKKRRFDDDARPRKFRDRDGEDGDFRKKRRFDDDDRRPRKFRDRDGEDGDFRKKRRFDDDERPRKFRDRDGEDGDFRKKRRFDDDERPRKFRDRDDDRRDRRDWSDREEEENENPLAKRRNVRALSSIGKMPSLPPSAPKMRSRGWRKKDDSEE